MTAYFLGLDLGQCCDFTAISVAERVEERGEWDPVLYGYRWKTVLHLRHIERLPLGTTYPGVVDRVAELTQALASEGTCRLAVDGTGVGRPVVDLLRLARLRCTLLPVMVTAGEFENQANGYHRVPKRDLIVGMQVALQRDILRIAAGLPFGETFLKEMSSMEIRVSAAGREQYGAWREGAHDDLVFAVALSYWAARGSLK
jgi:hypothetical protein